MSEPPDLVLLAARVTRCDLSDVIVHAALLEQVETVRAALQVEGRAKQVGRLSAAALLISYMSHVEPARARAVRRLASRLIEAAAEGRAPEGTPAAQVGSPRTHGLRLLHCMLLGEILVEHGVVDEAGVQRALQVQEESGGLFGEVLVALGLATREQVRTALAVQERLQRAAGASLPEELVPEAARERTGMEGLGVVNDLLLGEALIRRGALTRAQFERALREQRTSRRLLGEVLVDLGFVSWDDVHEGLREQREARRGWLESAA